MADLYLCKALWLTYDFHFVGGIDLSRSVGDVAGVLPAVLRRQVLQTQSPLLLLPFLSSCAAVLVHQRPTVLQPHNVGARVAACCALQTHWAAHGASDDALPHLRRLGETWTYCEWRECEGENRAVIRKRPATGKQACCSQLPVEYGGSM